MEESLDQIQAKIDARAHQRALIKAQKDAERQAFWEKYHEQLAKSTPYGGGAKHKRKIGKILRYI